MVSFDLKALRLLATQGRAAWSEVAKVLGFSAPSAAERVRQLEKRGVIRGYEARLDAKSLGYALTAFVAVTLRHEKDRARFLRTVAGTPEIMECHHISGEDDYMLKVRCKDTDDLERVISQRLKNRVEVRTRSMIVMSTSKETAVVPMFA